MVYNNTAYGYPTSYPYQYQPNNYYQPQNTTAMPSYQNQQYNSGLLWVKSKEEAENYALPPNSSPVALWDSEEQVIYIRSTDALGKPVVTVLDYTERGNEETKFSETTTLPSYATSEQFEELNKQLGVIQEQLASLNVAKPQTKSQHNNNTGRNNNRGK